jgi:hypothetical protein
MTEELKFRDKDGRVLVDVVNPGAKGSEPFALMSSEFIVDCLMNFEPEEREAVLRSCLANPYPDQAHSESAVAQIMAMVKSARPKRGNDDHGRRCRRPMGSP